MNKKGVTLIELLVVIVILAIVLAVIFKSYMMILKPQVQQQGIAETNVSNLIGIEILRKDIEMAGVGLPKTATTTGSCNEAVSDSTYNPDPETLNNCAPPLPFSFADNLGLNQSDVLVIRSSMVALSDASMNWGYIYDNGTSGVGTYYPLGGSSSVDNVHFSILDPTNKLNLVKEDCKGDSFPNPHDKIYMAFGIDDSSLRMPYNRVDYYLYRPTSGMPKRCSNGTYELYRAVIKQSDGKRNYQPLLDCVRNFQVRFGFDTNDNGSVDKWAPSDISLPSDLDDMDKELKQVRVYILYQEGSKDDSYTSPSNIMNDNVSFNISGSDLHYRWRVLRLVVNPLNIKIRERKLE